MVAVSVTDVGPSGQSIALLLMLVMTGAALTTTSALAELPQPAAEVTVSE
jgi:hypothetical protein